MSVYQLLNNQSTVQQAPGTSQVGPPGTNLPNGSVMATLYGGAGEMVQANNVQAFQINATCTSGNCSATVQLLASNDGLNWMNYGNPIVVTSGPSPQIQSANGGANWRYMSAYLTAVSGTGAQVDCLMSA